LLVMKSY